jgi:hypothetical protein
VADHGLETMRVMRAAVRAVERDWERQLGTKKSAELRSLLARLGEAQ